MSRILRGGVSTEDTPGALALARVAQEGFAIPARPNDAMPSLPDDITSLDDAALMVFFVRLTSWTAFAFTQHALAVVEERHTETLLEVAEARSLLSAARDPKAKSPVTFAKAERLLNDDVLTVRNRYDVAFAYRKLVEVLANNADRDAAVVSRELTRRTKNSGVEQRASRFAT